MTANRAANIGHIAGSGDALRDACVTPSVTRFKSLTLTYRQRSGKRVTCVTEAKRVTRVFIGVVARAHMRARKDINLGKRQTRHPNAERLTVSVALR